MNEPKDKTPPSDIPFDEAMARFLQTDPGALADAMMHVRQRQAEIEQSVRETRERILQPKRGKLRL